MTSFSRLFHLAGRSIIFEALSVSDAKHIFLYHGASEQEFADGALLKTFRNNFMKANHSDRNGGNDDAVKEVNAAYDVLAKNIPTTKSKPSPIRPTHSKNDSKYANKSEAIDDIAKKYFNIDNLESIRNGLDSITVKVSDIELALFAAYDAGGDKKHLPLNVKEKVLDSFCRDSFGGSFMTGKGFYGDTKDTDLNFIYNALLDAYKFSAWG